MSRPELRLAVALLPALTTASVSIACGDGDLDVFMPAAPQGGSGGSASGGSAGATSAGGSSNRGGSTSYGGSGSTGGSSGAPADPPNPLAVDDFEDGNTQALCGDGHWYVSNDGTGTQNFGLETANERPSGTHSMRTRGLDFSDWGAALGVDLEGSTAALDLTAYDELRFAIRAEPGFEGTISVSLLDIDDTHFLRPIEISSDWQELRLPLSTFLGPDDATLDRTRVGDLQFFVAPNQPFDFWIDDLSFFRTQN
jgi:hypothetical protein